MSNANERLKSGDSTRFWVSMILGTLLHVGLFVGFPTSTVADEVLDGGPTEVINVTENIPLPAAPDEIPRPASPVVVPDSDLTDPVTLPGFEDAWRSAPNLPPPPAEVATGADLPVAWTGPVQTYPRLLNRGEVERALERYYPTILRTAGIGGAPTVLFLIDVDGRVATRRLDTPSGHVSLDEAALAVADEMRFAPATNRDQPVAVWVSFPVRFQIR